MNTTRIDVPLTITPPHFDDDATIATARQVVPIKGSRRFQGRKIVTLLPLLMASTLCGALGAVMVNYYDRRRDIPPAVAQPAVLPAASNAARAVATPAATPPAEKDTEAKTIPSTEPAIASADEPQKTRVEVNAAKDDESEQPTSPSVAKRTAAPEAAKLVRKRRVQTEELEIPAKRKGASGIEDLFSRPNP